MILYFSGTGNSEYIAKRIGQRMKDETISIFDKIRHHDTTSLTSQHPWVIVVPTYAWRIPHIVSQWISETSLEGNRDVYVIMSCGGSIGNAEAYVKKVFVEKQMNVLGCIDVLMPENYIALFRTPSQEVAESIIQKAETKIDQIAQDIQKGNSFCSPHPSVFDIINSSFVNPIFYPMFVHTKKFYTTSACISCGLCEIVCPFHNIHLVNGTPVWGKECTHCMACINKCPKEAIEYGKHTKDLPRYTCPKKL